MITHSTHSYDSQVIVVGAGIAGLTAAYSLQQQGIAVRVIEASDRVGGRMCSDIINGHIVDCGAQFLSSEYHLITELLQQLGLTEEICSTSQASAIVRNGTPQPTRINRPLDALKLLGLPAMLKLGWKTWPINKSQKHLSVSDYSQWAMFDTESVAHWSNRELSERVTEYLYDPMLQGFYFQTPEQTSKALAVALTVFGMRRARTLSLKKGLGTLPEALARTVDVNLNTPVHAIETVNGQVHIHTPSKTLVAEHVILATPAPVSRKLLRQPTDLVETSLLATPYSTSINVACITDKQYALPPSLNKVYGLLIPRKERSAVTAVGLENNKNRSDHAEGHLLNIMFRHDEAIRLLPSADEKIVMAAIKGVADYFPTLPSHVTDAKVYRWPVAEPLSPVGRSQQLVEYRRRCKAKLPRIILAGDYMSMPFTEGAVESGRWAATMIAR